MSELVARMMAGPKKQKRGSLNQQTTDELAQRWRDRAVLDRATKVYTSLGDSVLTCAISDDETMFAGAGTLGVARVHATMSGNELASFELGELICAVAFTHSASGPKLVTGDFSGHLCIFDLSHTPIEEHPIERGAANHPKLLLRHPHGSAVTAMALPTDRTSSGDFIIAVMGLDSTCVYKVSENDMSLTASILCRINPMGTVLTTKPAAMAFDGDGHLLATGVEKVVELWSVDERGVNRTARPEVLCARARCTLARLHACTLGRLDTCTLGRLHEHTCECKAHVAHRRRMSTPHAYDCI